MQNKACISAAENMQSTFKMNKIDKQEKLNTHSFVKVGHQLFPTSMIVCQPDLQSYPLLHPLSISPETKGHFYNI